MAPKRNSKTKSRTKKAKNTRKSKADGMDCATDQDLAKLSALLAKHKVVAVLVHADWCGHCQTFKPLWEDYKKIPGRTVPMVSVNEKMLAKTPFKDAKIDGFPSTLVYSGKDGSFGSFVSENGQETNSMPNARDKTVMTKLLKARPSAMKLNALDSESVHATPEAEALLQQSGKKAVRDKDKPMVNLWEAEPPDTKSDTV